MKVLFKVELGEGGRETHTQRDGDRETDRDSQIAIGRAGDSKGDRESDTESLRQIEKERR